MKKTISIAFITLLSLIVIGCGQSEVATIETEEETVIENDVSDEIIDETEENNISDEIIDETEENDIVGTWTLKSQILQAPQGSMPSKFTGRTLTFNNDGTYTEDYSTESIPDTSFESPVGTVTTKCDVLGTLSGTYTTEEIANLDFDPPKFTTELKITPNGGSPKVTCKADGAAISTNAASIPLGVGYSINQEYVSYALVINNDLSVLTLTQHNPVTNIDLDYIFTK